MRSERAIDCHVHVFDPQRSRTGRHVLRARRSGARHAGPAARRAGRARVEHALLVGPNSGYGEDNRCLLDALDKGAGRYRGMAVVDNTTTRAELAELRAAGVVGVTFNAALLGVEYYATPLGCWPTWRRWT